MSYHRPQDLASAYHLLAERAPRLLAGGTDVYASSEGPGRPDGAELLDITAIRALHGICPSPQGWRIGAATTWAEVAGADLPPALDALKQAAREIGSPQIQNRATVAGNLCNASPAADGVPPLLVLDAMVETGSLRRARMIPLRKFVTGPRTTALRTDEMVIAVHVPASAGKGASAFEKIGARRHMVISIAMAAARMVTRQGQITEAAISVGACSPVARRLTAFEKMLKGTAATRIADLRPHLEQELAECLSPIDDLRADAAYRAHVAGALVLRCLARAASGATSQPESEGEGP